MLTTPYRKTGFVTNMSTCLGPGLVFWYDLSNEMLENRVLRRIFGSKRDEITRKWGKLRNE